MNQPVNPSPRSHAEAVATQRTGRRILINASALASSSLWRIITSLILQLVIARQLGPVGLGQYMIALAYLNVGQIISELGLPALLVRDLAQMPALRAGYYRIGLTIQLIASLLTWAGLFGLSQLLGLPPATQQILWVVGASLPFYAVTSVTQTLFQSSERMEFVMGVELCINTLILLLSVVVVLRGGTTLHLAVVLVVTQLISALISTIFLRHSGLFAPPQTAVAWQWSMLWQRAGPFYGLALADVLLQRTDVVLLSIVGGEAVTGIYGAAYNLVRVALKLVQNFWTALYPTLSRLYHHNQAHYQRVSNFSLHYGLLALLGGAAIGAGITQEALGLIYGAAYAQSAYVFQILLWSAPLYLLESYTQTLLMIERRPWRSLQITGLHLLALLLLLPLFVASAPGLRWFPAPAVGAAWAALLASAAGGASSLYLLQRWQMPRSIITGQARRGVTVGLVVGAALLSLYLPFAWPWRALLTVLLYGGIAWRTGLLAQADWALLRWVMRREREREDRE